MVLSTSAMARAEKRNTTWMTTCHIGVPLEVGGIDETLQQVDRRNADDGGRHFDLEHAGIDVRQPFRLVRVAFQVRRETKVS